MTPDQDAALALVASTGTARDAARAIADQADADWQEAIRAALAVRAPAQAIAEVADISRSRVYQIRDHRR